MDAHPALRSPALFLTLLPVLLIELSCGGGLGGIISAPAPSDVSAAPEQASAEWTDRGLAAAQRHIAQREYRASENGEGLQAPNRVHNLRTYFEPAGIRVHDRTRTGSPELLSLNLVGVGRGETLARVGPGEVSSEGARVEIQRPGLLEWYENSPAGLEQGFTLNERPTGEGPLRLELAVAGGEAALHGDAVVFTTATGRRLRYSKLVATDANGAALVARLEVPAPDRLQLWVDETVAVYPLTIDPILTALMDAQLESNQSVAQLGRSVSGAGDVNGDGYDDVIVGAWRYDAGQTDEGAAFVFLGSATGIADGNPSTAHAQLESNQLGAQLGRSVSGAGDVNGDGYDDVIVGALGYDAGETDEGAAFVFLGSAAGIADGNPSTAHAQLESNQDSAWLGYSVSGAGDVNGDGFADVIVGAERYDAGETDEGASFVFLGSATGIADGNPSTAHAQLESNQAGARLGWSVSGAGSVNGDGYADVIVGAPGYAAGQNA
ncbi:MAG: FG-GAP repeat protein, partial [Myxococcales bacterium]|nr:FG-GAP repeat protein [Myxococcales bacterium]